MPRPMATTTTTTTTMRTAMTCYCWALLIAATISSAAIVPPPWADPSSNPCASQPRGWQLLYWPADGKCYKIFQIGAPCPETMELGPAAVGSDGSAECRCPPGTAQSPRDALCHPIFTRASCPKGQYFAPVPESQNKPGSKNKRWGVCRDPDPCQGKDEIFWPRGGKCFKRNTRGPCVKGELLVLDKDGLATCSCSREGELATYFYHPIGGCYEHYTKGPCQEPGELYLPNGKCGCNKKMPQYHAPTEMCYQLGGVEPCPRGHHFALPDDSTTNSTEPLIASCMCKPNNVLYENGLCYRVYTQGPCAPGEMLINPSTCVTLPCKRGRLYFPDEGTCYKIGSRGPCPNGQVVLYDYTARPSVDGVSYNGVCGCTKNSGKCLEANDSAGVEKCEETPGMVMINGTCHKLYTQGPCESGEWLVATRRPRSRDGEFWSEENFPKARCECKPGYKKTSEFESNNLLVTGKCLAPTVGLAKYLNEMARSIKF